MPFPSTDTFGSLIDEVLLALQGWGQNKDQLSTLSSGISDSSLSLAVTAAGEVSRGLVEIDDELIWVDSSDGMTLTVPPWGRGFRGTIPGSHSAGAAVSVNPTWPRSVVGREINNTVRAVWPGLFAVKGTNFSASSVTWQYEIPADAERVLEVSWRWSVIEGWREVRGWELSHSADPSSFATGRMLSLMEYVPSGAILRVLYAALPTTFTNASDAFSVTGLPVTSKDIIVLGTAARLTPWLDVGRLPVQSVEADALDSPRPLGTAVAAARDLRARYDARLIEERRALFTKYPIRAHKVR
jgi:hypothetical protein